MANYYSGTIQKGSRGSDVEKWQGFLKSQGYDITVDGIFGDITDSITKQYQGANGLAVDGIVGEKTWGKADFSSLNNPTAPPTISAAPTLPTFSQAPTLPTFNTNAPTLPTFNTSNYGDTEEGGGKKTAMDDALENFNSIGKHTWGNEETYNELLNKYLNRDPFSYDLNGDALYQQYKDKYIQQGKLAMQDTMGQAAAMTGGYGSSFAQSAGQQAYQGSLDNLNDIVPELMQMAYDRYNQDGQNMLSQLGVLDSDYSKSYGEWEADYNMRKDKYGMASDDYYKSENSYNANRDNENNLAQQGYENNFNAWSAENDLTQADYENRFNAWSAGNDLLQKDYENKFNAWDVGNDNAWKEWDAEEGTRRWESEREYQKERDAKADEQWEAEHSLRDREVSVKENSSKGSGNTEPENEPETTPEPDHVNSPTYDDVVSDCDALITAGASRSEISTYLRNAWNEGYISDEQYENLKKIYLPHGNGEHPTY